MSNYRILVVDSDELLASFDSYDKAEKDARQLMKTTGKEMCVVEVKSTHSPVISSYEIAADYLGGNAKNHQKALTALMKLIVIAEAWNKQDGFVPDYGNINQDKWFPWFRYDNKSASFVYEESDRTSTDAESILGSRLCFKSPERVKQFGTQFINLWNDFLLFR